MYGVSARDGSPEAFTLLASSFWILLSSSPQAEAEAAAAPFSY